MILIWATPNAAGRKLIQDAIPDDDVYIVSEDDTPEQKKAAFLQANIVFGNVPAAWLPETKNLRWLQLESVGFGEYQDTVQDVQIITNISGFGKEAIAETILAGILGLYRRLDVLIPAQAEHDWIKTEVRASAKSLHGAQVIMLGHGNIGRYTRSILEAFGCTVLSFAKHHPAELRTIAALEEKLLDADIVIGCLPHTPETSDLLNADRLQKMKRGAMLVNVGRGSLIDETALAEALYNGQLSGAVIDVTREEPLPVNHPLWNCPNLILTQHTAGGFDSESTGRLSFFLSNLSRYRNNQPLLNIVDFQRGY